MGFNGLSRQSKIRQTIPLPFEMNAGPRGGLLPSQLQPETGANYQLQPQNKVSRSAQGYDVSPSAPSGQTHPLLYGV